ncbi:MAG: diguanylate cyclase [Mariprofundaceae bacterium]|nr:diguanylate cyclase [Mariprofundaceae bacterium]
MKGILFFLDLKLSQHIFQNMHSIRLVFLKGNQMISCTVSIGIVAYLDHASIESMISDADTALYHSKKTGRNKVTCFKDIA